MSNADRIGKGEVDLYEFSEVLKRLGGVEPESLERMVQQFDTDGDGKLDFVEFIGMMISGDTRLVGQLIDHIDMFKEVFGIFDVDKTGFITSQEDFVSGLMLVGGMSRAEANHFVKNMMATEALSSASEADQQAQNVFPEVDFKRFVMILTASQSMAKVIQPLVFL